MAGTTVHVAGRECVPIERNPTAVQYLLDYVDRHSTWADDLADGAPYPGGVISGHTSGPHAHQEAYNTKGVAIYLGTQAERDGWAAYVAYWEARKKPGDHHWWPDPSDTAAPRPPSPRGHGTWYGATWATIRKLLAGEAPTGQLELFP